MYISNWNLHQEIMAVSRQIEEQNGSEESRQQWDSLFQQFVTVEEGRETLSGLDISSVLALMMAGFRLEMLNGNYTLASHRMDLLFEHPDSVLVEPDTLSTMMLFQAASHLCEGDTANAIAQIRATFSTDDRRKLKYLIRFAIYVLHAYFLPTREQGANALPELIDLANDMLRLWKRKQRPQGLLTSDATYRQLADFLNAQFPR